MEESPAHVPLVETHGPRDFLVFLALSRLDFRNRFILAYLIFVNIHALGSLQFRSQRAKASKSFCYAQRSSLAPDFSKRGIDKNFDISFSVDDKLFGT